jgi:hypothetical protein
MNFDGSLRINFASVKSSSSVAPFVSRASSAAAIRFSFSVSVCSAVKNSTASLSVKFLPDDKNF